MGLDILPKAGSGFRVSTGAGNFSQKLSRLTSRSSGEFGNLRNDQQAIVNAMKRYAGAVKTYGGLSRMQRKAVIQSVKKSDKNLSFEDKKDLQKLVDYYARDKEGDEAKAELAKKEAAEAIKKPGAVRINRDENNGFDFNKLRSGLRSGEANHSGRVRPGEGQNKAKNDRLEAVQARIHSMGSNAGPAKLTPPKAATPPKGATQQAPPSADHGSVGGL